MSDNERVEVEIAVRTGRTEIRMSQEFLDSTGDDETIAETAAALGRTMSRFVNPEPEPWSEGES